mmetsp:Transcript_17144/g.27753  ORF Transcript_17144/g.27753 Transcript_17144/m.27753 type:complete len:142 (-) Transcript_17144:389-814(-)
MNRTRIPSEYVFILRRGQCNHPMVFYDRDTGFYIDLMKLEETGTNVKHSSYTIPKTSYYPTQECQLGGIEFHCPKNPLHFIGPPGRDYRWETLKLEGSLEHCSYYEYINGAKWDQYTMTDYFEIYGDLIDPKFDWLNATHT